MKKLTWLFLSLMLFLGMGVAFADDITVPAPVLNPAANTSIKPGSTIIPLGEEACTAIMQAGKMPYVMYTWDDASTELKATEDLMQTAMEQGEAAYKVGMWMMEWTVAITAPAEEGSHTLRVRMVAGPNPYGSLAEGDDESSFDDAAYVYGEQITATYTVAGDPVVETVVAPTLSITNGTVTYNERVKISVDASYEDNDNYVVCLIENPAADFDFSTYADVDDIPTTVKQSVTGANITKSMSIKVAIYKEKMGDIVAWSDAVEGTYTVPVAPAFNPDGGTVALDDKIELAVADNASAVIYYGNDATAFAKIKTSEALESASTVMRYGADDKIALEELGVEAGNEISISAATAVVTDGKVAWSQVITKKFTAKEEETPAITVARPVITPDPSAGPIKLNQKVTITCGTDDAEIYYTLDGSDPKTSDTRVKYTEPFLLPDNTPVDQEITIRAIAVKDGVYSDAAKVALMVEAAGEDPDDPTPTPAPEVKLGLTDFTTNASSEDSYGKYAALVMGLMNEEGFPMAFEMYYTIDGSEPSEEYYGWQWGDGPIYKVSYNPMDDDVPPFITFTEDMTVFKATGKVAEIDMDTYELGEYIPFSLTQNLTAIEGQNLEVEIEEADGKLVAKVKDADKFDINILYTTDGSMPCYNPMESNGEEYGEDGIVFEVGELIKIVGFSQEGSRAAGTAMIAGSNMVEIIKPLAPAFYPEAGEVPFGTRVYLETETDGVTIYYTLDGSEPTAESEVYNDWTTTIVLTQNTTIKAIAVIDDMQSALATAPYTVTTPEKVTLALAPMKDDTVGYNVATGITFSDGTPASEEWLSLIPASVYYTVDGTTEPSKAAYEAQADKENGDIKMMAVEWRNMRGTNRPVSVGGNFLSLTFTEATHLKAIGYLMEGEEVVLTTALLDTMLQIKVEENPTASITNYAEIKAGDTLVIKNPNPVPERPYAEDYESEDEWNEAYEAWSALYKDVPDTKLYFSFDGTKPSPSDDLGESVFSATKIDGTGGIDIIIAFKEDEDGLYAYVPTIYDRSYDEEAATIRFSGKFSVQVLATTTDVEEGEDDEPALASAKAAGSQGFTYGSDFVTFEYYTTPATLTFDPVSGSEVDENTAINIVASQNVEIFYMMFESEAAAKAAAWDQEKAESYSAELRPVVSAAKNTIKAAYARPNAETVATTFFYATYKVKELPAITLTFDPASGSEVEEGTEVTVTANREVEIFYNLYADKAAADADETFMANAKEVAEDGKPVITKAAPYLRCGVTDKGEMKYFDATYTVEVANEDLELAGVSVYPNPSNGEFHLELPVAATVEVFMSNGMLYQRLTLGEGNATLNINRSGIYFLRITGEGRTTVKRLIVR